MKATFPAATFLLALAGGAAAANLTLFQEYAGASFFDDWTFYGDTNAGIEAGPWAGRSPFDDTTNGDVFYMGRNNGSGLYRFDAASGHAFIQVDNTSVVANGTKRDSIRMTTQTTFPIGTVWTVDVFHLPWGCSVWPSIWTSAISWPLGGEIDIVEAWNRETVNQMSLHTDDNSGCTAPTNITQTGKLTSSTACTSEPGCTVQETQPASYGPDFNAALGGVWAAQYDVSGVFIWFWPRGSIPPSIATATDSIDISTWGTPSAAFPAAFCNITQWVQPQQLIIDITLCGNPAGMATTYPATCGNTPNPPGDPNNRCYVDNVIGTGSADLATAYFEIGAIRAYLANATAPAPSQSQSLGGTVSETPGATSPGASPTSGSGSGNSGSSGSGNTNAAPMLAPALCLHAVAVVAIVCWMLL